MIIQMLHQQYQQQQLYIEQKVLEGMKVTAQKTQIDPYELRFFILCLMF